MSIHIVIAAHKACRLPEDSLYMPLHVGAALHEYTLPFPGDDTGDNISEKNNSFCELTALYWAWKNLDADYIGLCHYRRFFAGKHIGEKIGRILTGSEAAALTGKADVLVPCPRHYFIETNYSQFIHAHPARSLDLTRELICSTDTPDGRFTAAFDRVMGRTWGHRFNMLIMRRDILNEYCGWLFDILFRLEARLDISDFDAYNARVYGFIAERLLDVWLEANNVSYREIPYVFLGSQHWLKKGNAFLKRKFFHK